jgi:Cu(I)/Ag(I) efflux system membrane fusion protein
MKNIKKFTFAWLAVLIITTGCTHSKQSVTTAPAANAIKYTCPMHPQILEDHPGSCPICGMTLVKKSGQASERAGISLNTVLQPVNSAVISSVSAITPQQKDLPTVI